jgi:hypothetical protein
MRIGTVKQMGGNDLTRYGKQNEITNPGGENLSKMLLKEVLY